MLTFSSNKYNDEYPVRDIDTRLCVVVDTLSNIYPVGPSSGLRPLRTCDSFRNPIRLRRTQAGTRAGPGTVLTQRENTRPHWHPELLGREL